MQLQCWHAVTVVGMQYGFDLQEQSHSTSSMAVCSALVVKHRYHEHSNTRRQLEPISRAQAVSIHSQCHLRGYAYCLTEPFS
jgi:hypothetical protein